MRPAMLIVAPLLLGLLLLGCGTSTEQIAQHRTKAAEYIEDEQWQMGEVLFHLQDYREGLWQFREAVRLSPDNNEWRLELAQVLFVARSYDDALENINQVLEAEPNNVDALLVRAGVRSVKGAVDEMLTDIDRALELDPQHKGALAIKAQALARKGDSTGAEHYLRQLLEVDPSSTNYMAMARFLSTLGRQDEALAMSQSAIGAAANDEERVRTLMNLANQQLNLGNIPETFEVLERARKEHPESDEVLLTLARLHHANGDRDRAEEILEEHADNNLDEPQPLLVLADYYRLLGEQDRAVQAVDRALEIDPDFEPARLRRAEYLHDGGQAGDAQRKEAWDIVESVLQTNPGSGLAHFTEGKFHLTEGDYEAATTSLRRVLDEQSSANAHVLLGTAYQKMGQLDLARSEYQQALQTDAQNVHARMSLAGLYTESGENELAVREARIALRQRPSDVRVRMILAQALVHLQRHAQAREALDPIGDGETLPDNARLQLAQLFRLANDLPTARRILGQLVDVEELRSKVQGELIACDVQSRKPADAIARLDGWIADQPDDPQLYLYRGRVRLGLSRNGRPAQPAETEADLKAAIDKGVAGTQAHLLLASFYIRSDRNEEAIATLKTAQKIDPSDTAAPFQLAGVYERAGRRDEAKQAYEEVLRLDQDQAIVKNNLAWLIADADDPSDADLDRAMQLAQDAKEALPNNPSVADTLGWVMYKKGIPSAAISLFHEAIAAYAEGHPLRGTVRFHLAMAYQRNGEEERAISELTRALDEVPSFTERTRAEGLLKELRTQ
jgi:tetratricopeptide (TPR) repeat protein